MSLRASAIYVASRAGAGALSLLAVALFARGLGPAGYAWYALATGIAALGMAIFLQPVQHALGRYLPADANAQPVLARLMLALMLALGIVAVLAEGGAHATGVWPVGLALAAWALGAAQGLFDFSAQHASASLRPGRYAALYLVKASCMLALGWLALRQGWGVPGVVFAVCGAVLVSVLACTRAAWRSPATPVPMRDWWPRLRTFCLPLGATLLLTTLLQWVDRFVLAAWVPAAELGAYAAVSDLTQQTLGFLFGSLYLAWYPRILHAHNTEDAAESARLASRYATLGMAVLLPALAGFVMLREPLVEVFFGAAFRDVSLRVLPWIAVAIAIGGVRMYFVDIGLYVAARMRAQLRNVAIAALVGIMLNLWWVPAHGVLGAAWAAVAAQVCGLVLAAWSARGVLHWRVSLAQCLPAVLGVAAMSATLHVLPGEGLVALFLHVSAGAAVYGLCMLLLDGAGCRAWLTDRLQRWTT